MTNKSIIKYKMKIKRLMNENNNFNINNLYKEKKKRFYKTNILNKIKEKYNESDDLLTMERSVSTEDTKEDSKKKNLLLGTTEEENIDNKEGVLDIETSKETQDSEEDFDTNKKDSVNLDNLSQDDLEDLANDTMLDVLQHIKELREKMKKENPEKAKFVRKIYDYLVKGKDKIASDIIKETQRDDIIENE